MISDDEGYRIFADRLTQTIERHKYFGADLLSRQRDQFVELIRLERQFREGLVGTEEGVEVYNAFVTKVCDENILTSRPYFRERQEICIGPITRALKQRFVQDLYQYNVNHNFVAFALKCRTWTPGHPLVAVAKAINKLRQEIVSLNMPLAISQARVFWVKAPLRTQDQRFSFMDFVQVAADGLLSAVDKFVLPPEVETNHLAIKVWRAVAIGRMRGNFIEMFSETSVHFFPGDKRKMYRANKHLRDFQGPLDYDILAQLVNRDLGPDGPQTNGAELADLMGAAANSVVGETEQDESYENPLQKAQASPEWRPDVRAEQNEMRNALFDNIEKLDVLEQKILRLKGIEKDSI